MKLTSGNIRKGKPGDVLRDEKIRGLHLRVFENRASYYLYYRSKGGKERRPKLGDHPALTFQRAREIARKLLIDVATGLDPVAEREAKRAEPFIGDLCDRYMSDYGSLKKTGNQDQALIDNIIKPTVGRIKVTALGYTDVSDLHRRMNDTPYRANRMLALLSKMMNLAEKWEYRENHSNPCRHVTRFKEHKRKRYMQPSEAARIATLLNQHKKDNPQSVLFIWLLILTGARKSEIASARWDWLEGNRLNLPDSKTGERTIYLPIQVMGLLKDMPHISDTITGIKDPKRLWSLIRKSASVPDLRLHDLRHSFASAALAAGLTLSQIGELLGHANTQTTHRYAHLMDETAIESANVTANKIEEMMDAHG